MTTTTRASRADHGSSTASPGFSSSSRTRKRSSSSNGATNSRFVHRGRLLFIICLCAAACALGLLAYFFTSAAETDLAERQFDSISERALTEAALIFRQKHYSVLTMASIVGQLHPNASDWPFVAIPGFENTVNRLLNSTSGQDMGFIPFVSVGELERWEKFAYDYYYIDRYPEPFDNRTAVSPFGRGIWGLDPTLGDTPPQQRYHDTTANTTYGSPYTDLLTPVFHVDEGANPALLFNHHSTEIRGVQIDGMLDCMEQKKNLAEGTLQDSPTCDAVTDMLTIIKYQTRGPAAILYEPIFPLYDPDTAVGLIPASLVFDEILKNVFADTVSGVDCVVSASSNKEFTYRVVEGVAQPVGNGDQHEVSFTSDGKCRRLTETEHSTVISIAYTLCLYPTDGFYEGFATHNPIAACMGAVLILAFTSLLFFVYDFAVRREFHNSKELLEAKRRFMRFVSHEVRTPLNAVCMGLNIIQTEIASSLGYSSAEDLELRAHEVQYLVEGCPQASSLEWFRLAQEVRTSAENATDVLSDLLNYDKIENGQFQLELTVIPIWRLIERTVNEFRLSAAKKNLEMELDFVDLASERDIEEAAPPPLSETLKQETVSVKVVGDVVRLTQVLRNLLSNAIKFTPEGGGSVYVRVSWCQGRGDGGPVKKFELKNREIVSLPQRGELRVAVEDSGAGLSAEQSGSLFRDGIQFNVNELQAGQGSGLGLYISKGIVEQHEGTLVAQSDGLHCGTTFTLSLPLYYVSSDKDQASKSTLALSTGPSLGLTSLSEPRAMRVLVVDDVASNRKLLVRLLEREGHICDQAENGQIAVDMVRDSLHDNSALYDTILLDYEMPTMSGPAAAREVRSLGCDVFIVGVTGNLLPEDVSHFLSCGANAVLPKPFTISHLEDLWMEYSVVPTSTDDDIRVEEQV